MGGWWVKEVEERERGEWWVRRVGLRGEGEGWVVGEGTGSEERERGE